MYNLKKSARCLVPHLADGEHNGFLVGTSSLRGPNEVSLDGASVFDGSCPLFGAKAACASVVN